MSTFPITPLPLPSGATTPPQRQDILDFLVKHPQLFQFFINALRTSELNANLDDITSYYRLAAIHGMPYVGWDSVNSPGPGFLDGNFCVHNEITFPTWHRVYMLLFERCLYDLMPTTPDGKGGQIRDSFRMPMWDWAAYKLGTQKYGIPDILAIQHLPADLKFNPLYQFSNPKTKNGLPLPMNDPSMNEAGGNDYRIQDPEFGPCTRTSRHGNPNSAGWVNGQFSVADLDNTLNAPPWPAGGDPQPDTDVTIGDMVYRVLNYDYDNYGQFASTKYYGDTPPASPTYLSLEFIHNELHTFIGSNGGANSDGHMANIPVAAFDPIFWLHHCYIDALFALWQSNNPSHWFDGQQAGDPLPTDKLDPFHIDTQSTSYNSNDVQNIATLNYSYPPLKDDGIKAQHAGLRNALLGSKLDGAKQWDYIINVIYDRNAVDEAYHILFFLDQAVPDGLSGSEYMNHTAYVGKVFTFSSNHPAECDNCTEQKKKGVLSRGQVPITHILLAHAKATPELHLDFSPDTVRDFLTQHLSWKIVTHSGRLLGHSGSSNAEQDPRLSNTKVYTVKGNVTYGNDSTPTKYHNETYEVMPEPTQGKYLGGSR